MKITTNFIWIILFSLPVWGHGEDKLGPNGGFIRMPGAFHTEIVPISTNEFKVFLLDINWKNPSTKDSSLKIIHQAKKKIVASCKKDVDLYYICSLPKNLNLKQGELLVEATRERQKGNQVSYELPLKLQKIDDGHGAHN